MVAEPGGSGSAPSGINVPVDEGFPVPQGPPVDLSPPSVIPSRMFPGLQQQVNVEGLTSSGSQQRANSEPVTQGSRPKRGRGTSGPQPERGFTENQGFNGDVNSMPPQLLLWMQQFMTSFAQGMQQPNQTPNSNFRRARHQQDGGDMSKHHVILDEKYFRRVDKFDGDLSKFRGWLFDLLVSIGQVDSELAKELKVLLSRGLDESWDPERDVGLSMLIYEKYASELYGLLCSLTTGEAKNVLKGIVDSGFQHDGFKALVILNKRFDSKTAASLLQSFLDVVSPTAIKGISEIVSGIHKWESKVAALKSRYNEDVNSNLKFAILIGMLPKDYQDMILQNSCMTNKVSYEVARDHVLNVANQRMQMIKPTPMDLGSLDAQPVGDQYEAQAFWDHQQDLDAVGTTGIRCYRCDEFGHYARDCPHTKGGPKGFVKGNKGYGKSHLSGKGDKGWGKGKQFGKGASGGGGKGYGFAGYNAPGFKGSKGGGKGMWNYNAGGKGYGYQGVCWKCGQVGHKANECTVGINGLDDDSENQEECSVEIGRVWNICCVGKCHEAEIQSHEMHERFQGSRFATGKMGDSGS